jgi:hypothetical protein
MVVSVTRTDDVIGLLTMLKDFTLPIDDAPDLEFHGELLARVTSSPEPRADNFSRHLGRWTELAVYRTAGGTYVCQEVRCSKRSGEQDRSRRASAAATERAVIAFFKQTALAKRLYAAAGITNGKTSPK